MGLIDLNYLLPQTITTFHKHLKVIKNITITHSSCWNLSDISKQLTTSIFQGEPVKPKTKPAPLDLPSDPHFTLTPPYTGTPRYLWTPTKSVSVPPSSFFSMEPKKIRIGEEYQATIPDLVTGTGTTFNEIG